MGLFRHTVYETATFYSVEELRKLLHSAIADSASGATDDDTRTVWHTPLFPPWMPWTIAKVSWGGFIAMALFLPDGDQPSGSS